MAEIKEVDCCNHLAWRGSLREGVDLGEGVVLGKGVVFGKGVALGNVECPRKEEHSRKGSRSFWASGGYSYFLLGPTMGRQYVKCVAR